MIKNIKNKHLMFILIIVFLAIYFNFFLNTLLIVRNNFDKRMIINHGYCEKEGYGFVNETKTKFKIDQNVRIINKLEDQYPTIEGYFYKNNQKFVKDYLILINFNENQIEDYLTNYKIIERISNCYLLKLND